MQKQLRFTGLDCPHCAEKLEKALNQIKDVDKVVVNFMASKLIIECQEEKLDEVIEEIKSVSKKVEKEIEYK